MKNTQKLTDLIESLGESTLSGELLAAEPALAVLMFIPGTGCVFLLWSFCGQWPQGSTFVSVAIIWEMFNNRKNEQAWQSTMLHRLWFHSGFVWACCPPVTPH